MRNENITAGVMQWVDEVVIHHNFCPFAKFVRGGNQIRVTVCDSAAADQMLEQLFLECRYLEENSQTSTTLLVLPQGVDDFDDYLDVLSLAETMMRQWGFEGTFQLASFHPDYVFAGEPAEAAGHFTNRSPYPIFHLIREADITRAMADYPQPVEAIYERNIETATQLGCAHFEAALSRCRQQVASDTDND